jgi:hypothetical protein
VGLFGFLRKSDERAMPEPGTPEFDSAVEGTAIRDAQSVSMGEPGWTKPGSPQTVDLRGSGKREDLQEVLRQHGIDPDQKGQTIDASTVPGLRKALLGVLMGQVPNSGGIDAGISTPKRPPPKPDAE